MAALANFIGFQMVWFSAVLGAGADLGLLGPVAVLLFAGATLIRSPLFKRDLALIIALGVGGWIADSVLLNLGLIDYGANPWARLAPLWIVALWINFALTLNHSLAWLQDRWVVAALFGAIGGPLAYLAGSALGAATFPRGAPAALTALGIVWAFASPLAAGLAARLGRI